MVNTFPATGTFRRRDARAARYSQTHAILGLAASTQGCVLKNLFLAWLRLIVIFLYT